MRHNAFLAMNVLTFALAAGHAPSATGGGGEAPYSYASLPLRLDFVGDEDDAPYREPIRGHAPSPARENVGIGPCRVGVSTKEIAVSRHEYTERGFFVEEAHFIPGSTLVAGVEESMYVSINTDLVATLVGDSEQNRACLNSLKLGRLDLGEFSLEGTALAAESPTQKLGFRRFTAATSVRAYLSLGDKGELLLADAAGLPVAVESSIFGVKSAVSGAFSLAVAPSLAHRAQ